MDVTQLPFNKFIGLEAGEAGSDFLVSLADDPKYGNHVGTMHAGALFAVAEAGSGAFLMAHFGDASGVVPLVRRVEAKYRKAASGRVSARCVVAREELDRWSSKLASQGRFSLSVPVDVVDASGAVVMSAIVEWFIARR